MFIIETNQQIPPWTYGRENMVIWLSVSVSPSLYCILSLYPVTDILRPVPVVRVCLSLIYRRLNLKCGDASILLLLLLSLQLKLGQCMLPYWELLSMTAGPVVGHLVCLSTSSIECRLLKCSSVVCLHITIQWTISIKLHCLSSVLFSIIAHMDDSARTFVHLLELHFTIS